MLVYNVMNYGRFLKKDGKLSITKVLLLICAILLIGSIGGAQVIKANSEKAALDRARSRYEAFALQGAIMISDPVSRCWVDTAMFEEYHRCNAEFKISYKRNSADEFEAYMSSFGFTEGSAAWAKNLKKSSYMYLPNQKNVEELQYYESEITYITPYRQFTCFWSCWPQSIFM